MNYNKKPKTMNDSKEKNCTDFDLLLAKVEWLYLQVQLYKQLKIDLELATDAQKATAQWNLLEQFLLLEKELNSWKH